MAVPPDRPRASRAIKLVLMGVAGAALLYSCAGTGGMGGVFPWLWFLGNPFSRGTAVTAPATTTAPSTAGSSQAQPSQRGGFGSSAGEHGSTAT